MGIDTFCTSANLRAVGILEPGAYCPAAMRCSRRLTSSDTSLWSSGSVRRSLERHPFPSRCVSPNRGVSSRSTSSSTINACSRLSCHVVSGHQMPPHLLQRVLVPAAIRVHGDPGVQKLVGSVVQAVYRCLSFDLGVPRRVDVMADDPLRRLSCRPGQPFLLAQFRCGLPPALAYSVSTCHMPGA